MKLSIALLLCFLFLPGCSGQDRGNPVSATPAIQSMYTDLGESCRKEPDKSDPNETPYLVCPGVAGYTLIVRRVDAGRRSIDVVSADKRAVSLNLQEFVTRHMYTLTGKTEWRVATAGGKQTPIALIVRVQAREDNKRPQRVTNTYVAVAKVTANETCVTDRFIEGTKSEAEVRQAADSAKSRQCVPPQPPMTAGGTIIR